MASEVRHVIKEHIEKTGMYLMRCYEFNDHADHKELPTCFTF